MERRILIRMKNGWRVESGKLKKKTEDDDTIKRWHWDWLCFMLYA